jgi:nitrite reductase (NO-forming)
MAENNLCSAYDTDEIGRKSDANQTIFQPLLIDRNLSLSAPIFIPRLIAEMMPGVTYKYWTYDSKIPDPFIRARAGDQVEVKWLN